jgi:hypothetical protein
LGGSRDVRENDSDYNQFFLILMHTDRLKRRIVFGASAGIGTLGGAIVGAIVGEYWSAPKFGSTLGMVLGVSTLAIASSLYFSLKKKG